VTLGEGAARRLPLIAPTTAKGTLSWQYSWQ